MFDLLLAAGLLVGATNDAATLLTAADAPRLAFIGHSVTLSVTVRAQGKADQSTELMLHVGAEDRQLVEFLDKRNRGRKFLTRGDRSWLLVPGARHPIAVSATQKMFGGLSFADVARVRLSEDYDGRLRAEREACADDGPETCRVVDIRARAKAAPYAAGMLWIDDAGLLRRAEYALASGKPAKRVRHEYGRRGGRAVLLRTEVIDLLNPQSSLRTEIEYRGQRRGDFPEGFFNAESADRGIRDAASPAQDRAGAGGSAD